MEKNTIDIMKILSKNIFIYYKPNQVSFFSMSCARQVKLDRPTVPEKKAGGGLEGRHAPPEKTNTEIMKFLGKNIFIYFKPNQANFFPMSCARQVKLDRFRKRSTLRIIGTYRKPLKSIEKQKVGKKNRNHKKNSDD